MRTLLWVGALALACLAPSAAAQTLPRIVAPSTIVPPSGVAYSDAAGATQIVSPSTPLPIAGRSETFRLAVANVSSPAATLIGGNYVLTQACGAYGTLTLRYLGPDGVTMASLASKTAADASGGTLVSLGANAIVDVALSGTTSCNATLSRIP